MIVPAQPVVAGRERPGHAVARGSVDELRARGGGRVAIDPHALESKRIIGSCRSPRTTSVALGSTSSRSPRSPSTIVGRKACSARVACEIRSLKSSATVGAPECADAVPGNARKPPMTINTRAGMPSPRPRDRWCNASPLDRTPPSGCTWALGRRESGWCAQRPVQCERPGAPPLPRGAVLQAGATIRRSGRRRFSASRARTARRPSRARKASAAALAVTTTRAANHLPSATDTSEREWAATLCSIVSCTSRNASPDMANRIADWSKERSARSHGSRKSRWRTRRGRDRRDQRPPPATARRSPARTSSGSRGLRRLGELSGRARCARPARRRRRPGSARARR